MSLGLGLKLPVLAGKRPFFGSADKAIKRYFTTIGATLGQYYSIPEVAVDRIAMDIYSPTGVTTGLPTGAPSPTANKYETLDFVYSGTIDEIGRNGATYVPDGTIIANVNLYFGGTLIHSYAIDEDLSTTTTIVDSVGSNDGAAVNIVESKLFTEVADGWEGVELEPQPFDVSTWIATAGVAVPPNQFEMTDIVGGIYKNFFISGIHRLSIIVESEAERLQVKDSKFGLGADPDIIVDNPIDQSVDYDFSIGGIYLRNDLGEPGDKLTVTYLSLKEFLEYA